MQPFNKGAISAALAGTVAMLAGCSEYTSRSDTLSPMSGNAVATNVVTQMVDPWPAVSADKNIAFNGDVMEAAYTRYRTGKVYAPRGIDTSTSYQAPSSNSGTPSNTTPVGPTVTQSAAPVK